MEHVLWELLKDFGSYFWNPLFLLSIVSAVMLGYVRVKRERRQFHIRLLPGWTESRTLYTQSWWYGLLLSVLVLGIGLIVDLDWLILFVLISCLLFLTFYYQVTSPIYPIALTTAAIALIQQSVPSFSFMGWVPQVDLSGAMAFTTPVLAGLLLFVEGQLVRKHIAHYTTPVLLPTQRGLHAALFKGKRLWVVPLLLLVPGEIIPAALPYWPQFTLGATAFAIIPIPFLIGFSQVAKSSFPEELFPRIGRAISWIGVAVILIAFGALWFPFIGWLALAMGVVSRSLLTMSTALRERRRPFLIVPQSIGVMIAGVLPDSPGERLGLLPGDCIRAVNGVQVTNERELYDALQVNAAHCRLQVIGRDGEVRLMQQVLYRHDHHCLGLLFLQ